MEVGLDVKGGQDVKREVGLDVKVEVLTDSENVDE